MVIIKTLNIIYKAQK